MINTELQKRGYYPMGIFNFINRFDDIFIVFLSIIIFPITVALVLCIKKKTNEGMAIQSKLQQAEMELKLNIDMVTITDTLRKLRHDLNNHLGLIKSLAKEERYEELKDYIDQIYEDVELANDLILTENKTLSILLNSKKCLAKGKNIDFTSIITTQEINMQSKDICSLLCNILDNAIESAEKSKHKKYIQLMIQKTEEGCVISCENSIGLIPVLKRGKFISNKANSLLHGIGTEKIRDIVQKYNGEIMFEYDEEYFNVHVILPV